MNNHKNIFDVCIIGGGAAGLFCSVMIKRNNPALSVAIIERQKDVGKKLLATGNGRCNLTNIFADKSMYHGSFKDGAAKVLDKCSPDMVIDLFRELGLLTTNDAEGRVYPYSKHSSSVLDCLKLNCKKAGVEIFCNYHVTAISKTNNKYNVKCLNDATFTSDILIIASGSKATPETGADDSIFSTISKNLGHTITKLYPALCPIPVKSKSLNSLKGVRATGKATILVDDKEIKSEIGEIQFTDKTLSGICLFNLSRIANTSVHSKIRLSLLPHMSIYEISEMLMQRASALPGNTSAEDLLCGIFQKKLSCALLKDAGMHKDATINNLCKNSIRRLATIINNWDFPVIPSDDFKRAQVVAGGIQGSEIDTETMESKKNKNLYIIGEAADCDGDCGGLNLQFAFSSAYCAAMEL